MNNKKDILRAKAKVIRQSSDTDDCSDKIIEHLCSWDNYINAKNVMLFYPINKEISLLKLLSDKNKSFFFPVVDCGDICPVLYNEDKGFVEGAYNINEPVGTKIFDFKDIDLIIIPALCADLYGYRIGYGKGFYDRFLEKTPAETVKVIPILSELLYETLPCENHDKKADYIITEKGIISAIG